jgi:hypothetical protein
MSYNLLQKVQEKMGCQPLQKIDVNTLEVVVDNATPDEEKFSQAIIPTVLTALYKFSRDDVGAETILHTTTQQNWSNLIFDTHKDEVVEKIVQYAYHSKQETINKINSVAIATIELMREHLTANTSITELKNLLADSLNNTLLYLPTNMHIGVVLKDNTLDDGTLKMEGPVSSVMNAIGSLFSQSDNDEVEQPDPTKVTNYATMLEAINGLKTEGYTEDLNLENDSIECVNGNYRMLKDDFVIDKYFRFDDDSDPDNQSIIYAISSPKYNIKGMLVNAYGIYADSRTDLLLDKMVPTTY